MAADQQLQGGFQDISHTTYVADQQLVFNYCKMYNEK